MKIEVLGDGCSTCNKLYESVLRAVKLSGKEVEVTKVMDIQKFLDHKVMSMPTLVIDGAVKVSGRVPKVEEIKDWIEE